MISATFIFKKKQYDAEFERLNSSIDQSNAQNPEYRGKDNWTNSEKDQHCVVYYYASMAGLTELRNLAHHREAKSQYSRWYEGYHVVISEVKHSYGDGAIEHPTPAVDY